jgi:hypothetical protein
MAQNLSLLSSEIMSDPIDLSFNQHDSVLYVVLEDGTISNLTLYRTEQVKGWSKIRTEGSFVSVAISGDDLYFITKRGDKYYLELTDADFFVDCGIKQESPVPQKVWSGFDLFEGKEISIMADGYTVDKCCVENGSITLLNDASVIYAGYPYSHVIEPLPHMIDGGFKPYPPTTYRIISGIFRIIDSGSFYIDMGNGQMSVPLRKMSDNQILEAERIKYSGDIKLRSIGWIRDMDKSPWRIESDDPSSFTLLSVSTTIKQK